MSLSLSRAWLLRAAGILACGPAMVILGGCHQRSSSALELLSPAERGTDARRQEQKDNGAMRHFPGVDVARGPTGGVTIRLVTAMFGDGEPLYIVDGTAQVGDPRNGFTSFEPEDIVEIKVFKYPAETAVYGPRGVNGVVLITTRQAVRARSKAP